MPKLTVIPAEGGPATALSAPLDRWCHAYQWARDGRKLFFIAESSGRQSLYEVLENGEIRPVIDSDGQVKNFALTAGNEIFFTYGDFTLIPNKCQKRIEEVLTKGPPGLSFGVCMQSKTLNAGGPYNAFEGSRNSKRGQE